MTETPNSLRLQIGIFGRTNSGKSSLLNAIAGQNFSIVSEQAGTTADPVKKAMEIAGLGPVLFIDTAGFDDETSLGEKRMEKTADALNRTDIVLAVFSRKETVGSRQGNRQEFGLQNLSELSCRATPQAAHGWFKKIAETGKPVIPVLTKIDSLGDRGQETGIGSLETEIEELTGKRAVCVSAKTGQGIDELIEEIKRQAAGIEQQRSLTGSLCAQGDLVLLVMPQDIQAPKGRLILPQVQVMRELLDKKCVIASCAADMIEETLRALTKPPKLIITDSQVFGLVSKLKPKESALTSFSVLMAAAKGDINLFKEGAAAIAKLNSNSRVLIAEACTHAPQEEDIGRVKIPRMLGKIAPGIKIDFVRGMDFCAFGAGVSEKGEGVRRDSSNRQQPYDLIIHCGACMFNRAYVLHRQEEARAAGVPMTNYGIAIAQLTGILEQVRLP